MFRFKIKAPEFVMRQWYKHVVGIETTSSSSTKDHAWSEISGRYIPVTEIFTPQKWRKQSASSKQGSDGDIDPVQQQSANETYAQCIEHVMQAYHSLLDMGVAKEQARILLPLSQYTQVIWTCSAQALYNFIELRDAPHAQQEIREYASQMKKIIKETMPVLYDIWWKY